MSDEKFELYRIHKMQEWLEREATEWVLDKVTDYFGVENAEELSREQLDEVIEYWEDGMTNYYDDQYIGMALRNVIATWENEHDEYIV